jgi:hypothetical protein
MRRERNKVSGILQSNDQLERGRQEEADMKTRITALLAGAVAVAASSAVWAQRSGSAFTATGTSCDQVTWTGESLRAYPNIATACRDVLQRDGKYFVRFEGEVLRVADRGQQITIDFRDGDRVTLAPPENLSLTINGMPTAPQNLRPGDQLTFYIPQDQLAAATFFAGQPETAPAQEVPISPALAEPQVAAATPAPAGVLPSTASALPLLSYAGLFLVLLGAALTVRRLTRPA